MGKDRDRAPQPLFIRRLMADDREVLEAVEPLFGLLERLG